MTREISGLSEIIDQFDAVLVDQFGVLHDGARQFPGALAALEELAKNDIPVVALTNSGKRSSSNLKRLEKLGFHQKLFHQVLSSGELARGLLEKLPDGCPISLVSRDGETELIEGLRLNLVSGDHARPAMVVLAGIRPEQTSREAYQAMLAPHAKRGAALLLVNPDTLMAHGTDVHFGPGAVAADYAAAGGAIIPLGKPSREIFRAALDLLSFNSCVWRHTFSDV